MIIFKNRVWTVNHMNHDVAEVNGSDLQMLPGSSLYEKEPWYEASRGKEKEKAEAHAAKRQAEST